MTEMVMEQKCGPGSKITGFWGLGPAHAKGRYSHFGGIGIQCDDGTIHKPMGRSKGRAFTQTCSQGMKGFSTYTDAKGLTGFQANCPGEDLRSIGQTGGKPLSQMCKDGEAMVGVRAVWREEKLGGRRLQRLKPLCFGNGMPRTIILDTPMDVLAGERSDPDKRKVEGQVYDTTTLSDDQATASPEAMQKAIDAVPPRSSSSSSTTRSR